MPTTITKAEFLLLAAKSIAEYPIYKDDGTTGAVFEKDGQLLSVNNDNKQAWPVKYVYSSLNPKAYKFSMKFQDVGFYLQKLKTNDQVYRLEGSYVGDIEITEDELEDLLSILTTEYTRRTVLYTETEKIRKLELVEQWKKELNIK